MSDELRAGSVIGKRYRLERRLEAGGMGVVWAASHIVTRRPVAIKLLRPGGRDDAAIRARMLREARASCAVEHPSVVPVLDVLDAGGAPALVMELLHGESLRDRLEREGALSARATCELLGPVASALAAAHAVGVVHRDIKPENVFLVEGSGAVRVLDFGVAKIIATEEATSSLTETGEMVGTPYYMAPEQAFGERDIGPAADAWALGVVLYECLAGVRPTQAENLGQVIKLITQTPMKPIDEVVPGVPPELAALVLRLLERDPARREVAMDRVTSTLAAHAEITPEHAPARARGRSRSRVVAALGLSLLAAGGLAVYALYRAPASAGGEHTPPAVEPDAASLVGPRAPASVDVRVDRPPSVAPSDGGTAAPPGPPAPGPSAPPPASTVRPPPTGAAPPSASVSPAVSSPASPRPPPGPGHIIIDAPF